MKISKLTEDLSSPPAGEDTEICCISTDGVYDIKYVIVDDAATGCDQSTNRQLHDSSSDAICRNRF